MAGFFRRVSETESETESSDEERERIVPSGRMVPASTKPMSAGFMMSDSEEETKRVVKTVKDKRYDEIKELIKSLKNSIKIKDMSKVLQYFEDISKAYEKSKNVLSRDDGRAPKFYVRTIVELDDFVNENYGDLEGRKNLSKNNARGLTTLRQKLRKYIRDYEDMQVYMADFRQNPDEESEEEHVVDADELSESEESEEDSEDEAANFLRKEKEKEKPSIRVPRGDGDEDDESDWERGDEESSESDLEDLEGKEMEELRKYFLKKAPTKGGRDEKEDAKEKRREQERRRRERHQQRGGEDNDGEWQNVDRGARVTERPKLFEKDAEIDHAAVLKKLAEIVAARGKKGTDRKELTELLVDLLAIAQAHTLGPAMDIKMMLALTASLFDYNPKYADSMEYATWRSALQEIKKMAEILATHNDILVSETVDDEHENVQDASKRYQVKGCLLSMLERLDDEFTKILQCADCHSNDYVEKLKGETDLCALIEQVQQLLEMTKAPGDELCRVYMRHIEHMYYKFQMTEVGASPQVETSTRAIIQRLCQFMYTEDQTRRLRSRAILCQIYHHALHDRWQEARDLMLMSHLQATIDHSDVYTQILHNRVICQMGLCAFRHGFIREAHNALSDIQNGGKARELLAQGLSTRGQQERTAEQEKLERQRQIPYHMHINLELLETTYLVTAMLLEIPQMASKEFEVRRRLISRSFHYQLKQSEKQSVLGPPENTREHVVAASRALLNGDWRTCRDLILSDKMNAKVWNLFHRSQHVKDMLVRRIQEECLRTFLLTYSTIYEAISFSCLAEMFDMDKKAVHSLISKMIINEELSASMDEPKECVVMHRTEPTKLQTLALQLTEKLNQLADYNDQIMDPRSGQGYVYRPNYANWFQQRQQGGGRQQQQQQRNY